MHHELAVGHVRRATSALGPYTLMPLKGALLGRRYYDHPSERAICDCDVLIVGVPFREALRRLRAQGFIVREWSKSPHIATLALEGAPGFELDVHASPLPRGFGAVTAEWLARDAERDESLFGAPVLLPHPSRLLVHLLGNIGKDHIYRAADHCAHDVDAVLARSGIPLHVHAQTIRAARLSMCSWMAVDWVVETTGSDRARALMRAIGLRRDEEQKARARLAILRESSTLGDRPSATARFLARTCADDLPSAAIGLAWALVGTLRARVLNAWLPPRVLPGETAIVGGAP
jgi:hypothetical protein